MGGTFVTRAFVFCCAICLAHWTQALGAPGDLDPAFGAGGKVFANFGGFCEGHALAVQPDGKIIGLGTDFGDFALARWETGIPVPQITDVSIHGKNLTVLGTNFDAGAVILLNGVPQKTISDSANPGTTLIGVKVGRLIRPGDSIRVQNASGFLSRDFIFTGSAAKTLGVRFVQPVPASTEPRIFISPLVSTLTLPVWTSRWLTISGPTGILTFDYKQWPSDRAEQR